MAKFCIHCGRKLEDGEVCACQIEKQTNTFNIGAEMLDVIKGMFVKPADTIKKYTDEKNFNLALIFVLILSLVSGIFMMSFVSNVSFSLFGASAYLISYHIPYLQIFFASLFGIIIYSFVYVGFLYLVNSIIFKGGSSFKKTFVMYGINSVILTSALFISMILMFVNSTLGLIIFVLGSILNMLYIFKGIEYLGVKDKNKHGYIYMLAMVFCLILFIIVSLFVNAISGSHYNNSNNLTNGQYRWVQDSGNFNTYDTSNEYRYHH